MVRDPSKDVEEETYSKFGAWPPILAPFTTAKQCQHLLPNDLLTLPKVFVLIQIFSYGYYLHAQIQIRGR